LLALISGVLAVVLKGVPLPVKRGTSVPAVASAND
jgi:hypothetical protein